MRSMTVRGENELPLVSIIINCFNGEQFLREAVDSVIAQSYPHWEIIFWNNKSIDRSREIIESFDDERIRIFESKEHTSLGHARNLAMNVVQGQWCGFLDCDDLWRPDKLKLQIDLAHDIEPYVGMIYAQTEIHLEESEKRLIANSIWQRDMTKYSSKTKLKRLPSGDIFDKLVCLNFVPFSTALFRTSAVKEIGGFNTDFKLSEDYDLMLRLSKKFKVMSLNESCTTYRVHANNQSANKMSQMHTESMQALSFFLPAKNVEFGMMVHKVHFGMRICRTEGYRQGIKFIVSNCSFAAFVLAAWLKVFRAWW